MTGSAAITTRWATPSDFDALGRVMYGAVRTGPSRYTETQRAAWVPEPRSGDGWNTRLSKQQIILAEQGDSGPVGFMSLTADGYLDFAFILPSHQGTGLFRRLYAGIEALAREQGHPRIHVHASLMASPAFARLGFVTLQGETVQIGDQWFDRSEMEKRLTS